MWVLIVEDADSVETDIFIEPCALRLVVGWEKCGQQNFKKYYLETSLAIHWLRLCPPNAGGTSSIQGWETKILHAAWCGQKNK